MSPTTERLEIFVAGGRRHAARGAAILRLADDTCADLRWPICGSIAHRSVTPPRPTLLLRGVICQSAAVGGYTSISPGGDAGATETALPQTFVMTFADLATQRPVGELGSFDPVTGQGSVVTPDVTCGPWPVVATCVQPTFEVGEQQRNRSLRHGGGDLPESV